jgi:predicted nuclease with TOPRIM domain
LALPNSEEIALILSGDTKKENISNKVIYMVSVGSDYFIYVASLTLNRVVTIAQFAQMMF